ncbi:MAG TPA: sigma-70 family RNA polymerase sigma factor, partial [Phycisphaerae bacterium]|nr:sigma-70 family RNA polymerase sigma factor [Phycisphaerae bacterium]
RMLGGPGREAEDLVQGVFWLLAQRASRVKGEKVGGWLYRAAVYGCRRVRKEEGRRKKRERAVGMREEAAAMEEGDREAVLGMLDEGMLKLNERERRAVVARYLEGKSAEEAGAELGVSAAAAEKRAREGRIVGHGSLAEMVEKAGKVAARARK